MTKLDKRRKLTYGQRKEIHDRIRNKAQSGETIQAIAAEFGINRNWASTIARTFKEANEAQGV